MGERGRLKLSITTELKCNPFISYLQNWYNSYNFSCVCPIGDWNSSRLFYFFLQLFWMTYLSCTQTNLLDFPSKTFFYGLDFFVLRLFLGLCSELVYIFCASLTDWNTQASSFYFQYIFRLYIYSTHYFYICYFVNP